jgi:CheY-like chemotaxis protein
MQGWITVNSTPFKGSEFTLRLPLEIHTQHTTELPPPKTKLLSMGASLVPAKKPHILLVEDNSANVLIATLYLESLHCTYDTASSGAEALQKFMENDYALILMDVQMQDMDGYEATRHIRNMGTRNAQTIPIIAVTAHAMTGDKEKCFSAGMTDYITKPLRPENLQEKLNKYLEPEAA